MKIVFAPNPEEDNSYTDLQVGDVVFFGTYEQDSDYTNGPEDIEWTVLAVQNDRALLISNYILDYQKFNANADNTGVTTWENSTLRSWLNSTFYTAAFTLEEQEMIATTTVSASAIPVNDIGTGRAAQDKVLLLSADEVNEYFSEVTDRICALTDYAVAQGACDYWWLRSYYNGSSVVAGVDEEGRVLSLGEEVRSNYSCVRPVLWLDMGA